MSQPPTTNKPELLTVITDVLGDLAFMASDDECPDLAAGTIWMQAEVQYLGPQTGTLRCWCTRDFAVELAANLLGIEPEEGEAMVAAEDALREFMNVLCGQVVTAWHGTEAVYNLSIPKVCECMEAPRAIDASADASCQIAVDGEPLFFTHHRDN